MSSFRILWYLTSNSNEVTNVIQLRGQQLNEQIRIDYNLKHKCQECPELVSELLLIERDWNRQSSQGFQHCPSVEMYMESVKDNIEMMDRHQKMLCNLFSEESANGGHCEYLKRYLEGLEEKKS
ncbi:hypothetical protein DRO61_06840 [Candidatus Bathyarchaeota archaeon]|nr:MAG: hypothetical protein DRO61_06840 [Candidatus Bathyarchaeota archaeon]